MGVLIKLMTADSHRDLLLNVDIILQCKTSSMHEFTDIKHFNANSHYSNSYNSDITNLENIQFDKILTNLNILWRKLKNSYAIVNFSLNNFSLNKLTS